MSSCDHYVIFIDLDEVLHNSERSGRPDTLLHRVVGGLYPIHSGKVIIGRVLLI